MENKKKAVHFALPSSDAKPVHSLTGNAHKSPKLSRQMIAMLKVADSFIEANVAVKTLLSEEERQELQALKMQALNAGRGTAQPEWLVVRNTTQKIKRSGNLPFGQDMSADDAARQFIEVIIKHAPNFEADNESQLAKQEQDDAATKIQAMIRAFLLRRNVVKELEEDMVMEREVHSTQLISLLNKGMEIQKFPRNGRAPETRVLWLDMSGGVPRLCVLTEAAFRRITTSGRGCKGVLVTDIAEIRRGAHSEVFQRQRVAPDPNKCFSIITSDRTWDFGAASRKSRSFLVECLRHYVETVVGAPLYAARGHQSYRRLTGLRMARISIPDVRCGLRFNKLMERGMEMIRHQGSSEILVTMKIEMQTRRLVLSRRNWLSNGRSYESVLLDDIAEIRPGSDCVGFRPGVDTSTTFAIIASESTMCLETSNARARALMVRHFQAFLRLYRHRIDG